MIELACGPVPEGHSRWTIRLLEEESRVILETLPTGTDEVKYTVTVRSVGRYGKKEYIHSISNTNKNGSDTLEVNKKNFYNANGVYDIHIMAYDASGDLITYCDTSTTLK